MKKSKKSNLLVACGCCIGIALIMLIIHIAVYGGIKSSVKVSHCFGFSFAIAYIEVLLWFVSSALFFGIIDVCTKRKKATSIQFRE